MTEDKLEMSQSERQVRRLVFKLGKMGDRCVIHGQQGRPSNRKISPEVEKRAIEELKKPQCHDFGPTYGAEHLERTIAIKVGRDTVRKWLTAAGLWKSKPRQIKEIHQWRARRSCCGELVQWDTSVHKWLEYRGDKLYLIAMIDDATSRLFARFAIRDTAEENLRVLWQYLNKYGRPVDFYTDKAGMFEVNLKQSADQDQKQAGVTQITRALTELGIGRISAHSPQAKGRIERCFGTLQDRLIKHLRLAGAATLEQANAALSEFLEDWNQRFTVEAANPTDAHRPLAEVHCLAASLAFVESRRIGNDYTIQFHGQRYQIAKAQVKAAMRGKSARLEARLDGTVMLRYEGTYLEIAICPEPVKTTAKTTSGQPVHKDHNRGGRSSWMTGFSLVNRNTTAKFIG